MGQLNSEQLPFFYSLFSPFLYVMSTRLQRTVAQTFALIPFNSTIILKPLDSEQNLP